MHLNWRVKLELLEMFYFSNHSTGSFSHDENVWYVAAVVALLINKVTSGKKIGLHVSLKYFS